MSYYNDDYCNLYRIASKGEYPSPCCENQYDIGYQEYEFFEHIHLLEELQKKCVIPRIYTDNIIDMKNIRFFEVA